MYTLEEAKLFHIFQKLNATVEYFAYNFYTSLKNTDPSKNLGKEAFEDMVRLTLFSWAFEDMVRLTLFSRAFADMVRLTL